MSDVTDTQGTILRRQNDDSPAGYDAIPRVYQIDPISIARTLRQITDLSHTDTHKHKLGLADMPEITVEAWYDPKEPMHQQIFADHASGETISWQVELADDSPATVIGFTALVLNPSIGAPNVDGDIPLRFALKPQSLPTGLYE